jgi:hypothetical protein
VFSVASIAAGAGRVALIRAVGQLSGGSCPPAGEPCYLPAIPIPLQRPLSTTLLAGRPGAIRELRTTLATCHAGPSPALVAVSSLGLVVSEEASACRPNGDARVVLRSFSGKQLRLLDRQAADQVRSLSAAGHWAGWLGEGKTGKTLHIVDLRSGRTVLRSRVPNEASELAIDARGDFAISIATASKAGGGCPGNGSPSAAIRVASVGDARQRTIVGDAASQHIAISRGKVAFQTPAADCSSAIGAAVFGGAGNVFSLPALSGLGGLAYNGLRSL